MGLDGKLGRRVFVPSETDQDLASKMYKPNTAQAMLSSRTIIFFEVYQDASDREVKRPMPQILPRKRFPQAMLSIDDNITYSRSSRQMYKATRAIQTIDPTTRKPIP